MGDGADGGVAAGHDVGEVGAAVADTVREPHVHRLAHLECGYEHSEWDGEGGAGDAGEEVEEDVAHQVEEDRRRLSAPE